MTTRYRFVVGVGLLLLIALVSLGGAVSRAAPLAPHGTCPEVANSLYFTIVYGAVTIDGVPAPLGSLVEARNSDGVVVGCAEVTQAGSYGTLYIYGADESVSPAVPGMRDGETVVFYVDGQHASAESLLLWHNDRQAHLVDLQRVAASGTPTLTATPEAPRTCPAVQNSLKMTIVYGEVLLDGLAAPVGSLVEARNPDGVVVGCAVVTQVGSYGTFYVYGADDSVSPAVPGMRDGEAVAFYVNQRLATATPLLAWANDRDFHAINLNASLANPTVTPEPTVTPAEPRVYLPVVARNAGS